MIKKGMFETQKIDTNNILYYMNVRKLTPSYMDLKLGFSFSELLDNDDTVLEIDKISAIASILNVEHRKFWL